VTRKQSQKAAKRKADIIFSKIVRAPGRCENCYRTALDVQLQCAHWISRRYSNTRVDPDNAFCLCAACHRWFTNHPTEWGRWAISKRGEDTYRRLFEAAQQTSKVDWVEQVEILKKIAESEGVEL
jgi:hypothetical protein